MLQKIIIKLLLFGGLFFVTNQVFSQTFSDSIFTKSDTILCKITLVNNVNIFYDTKVGRRVRSNHISLAEVKSYTRDSISDVEKLNVIDDKQGSFIYQYDTLKHWVFGVKSMGSSDYPLIHGGLLFSMYKQNHNLHFGPEMINLQKRSLRGDPINLWEKKYYGLNLGYRYFPRSNFKTLHYYLSLQFTFFEGKYTTYQNGPPFSSQHEELIILNTGGVGVNYKWNHFNLFAGIGLTSTRAFFLIIDEPIFDISAGVEYKFSDK